MTFLFPVHVATVFIHKLRHHIHQSLPLTGAVCWTQSVKKAWWVDALQTQRLLEDVCKSRQLHSRWP